MVKHQTGNDGVARRLRVEDKLHVIRKEPGQVTDGKELAYLVSSSVDVGGAQDLWRTSVGRWSSDAEHLKSLLLTSLVQVGFSDNVCRSRVAISSSKVPFRKISPRSEVVLTPSLLTFQL